MRFGSRREASARYQSQVTRSGVFSCPFPFFVKEAGLEFVIMPLWPYSGVYLTGRLLLSLGIGGVRFFGCGVSGRARRVQTENGQRKMSSPGITRTSPFVSYVSPLLFPDSGHYLSPSPRFSIYNRVITLTTILAEPATISTR